MKHMVQLIVAAALLSISGVEHCWSQLVDNGDGTVTDASTGLMWMRDGNVSGSTLTRAQADEALVSINNDQSETYGDWRLPSDQGNFAGELSTLSSNYGLSTTNPGPFVNIQMEYWTSGGASCAGTPCGVAYAFWAHDLFPADYDETYAVWPVRDDPGAMDSIATDLSVRDCWIDDGREQTADICQNNPFAGPDIRIGKLPYLDEMAYGEINRATARVTNQTDGWVANIQSRFYYWNCDLGSTIPVSDAVEIGDGSLIDNRIALLAPGEYGWVKAQEMIPQPPSRTEWCFGVKIVHADDQVSADTEILDDNNLSAVRTSLLYPQTMIERWRSRMWRTVPAGILAGLVLGFIMARKFSP